MKVSGWLVLQYDEIFYSKGFDIYLVGNVLKWY